MNTAQFPGSRWWKFDFHTHTPKSNDYGRGDATLKDRTPEEWLLDFMKAGFDAVAITDHNSGEWIDSLKAAHETLRAHTEFRELTLFPGVEVAANGGIHVLLLLDPSASTSDVAGLIRSCGYTHQWGDDGERCSQSLEAILELAVKQRALVIPAHVDDQQNALWMEDHKTLCRLIEHRDIFAWERKSMSSNPPPALVGCAKRFSEVLGSDSHKPSSIGKQFTWVKMSKPNLEGLRLALLDGELCLRRSDQITSNPNHTKASFVIERFEIDKAQFIGRPKPFVLEFNPWMNAFIGARGTGKSTLLEFMRIALRREGELNPFDELKSEFNKKYAALWQGRAAGGLQTPDIRLSLIYRKDGQRYRVNFTRDGSLPEIEEDDGTGAWKAAQGDIASRFPIRIYSQKQIFELAGAPSALLQIIDQDSSVNRTEWEQRWAEEREKLKGLSTKIREIRASLEQENRLQGELADVNRKLEVLQATGNQDILSAYQRTSAQKQQVDKWASEANDFPHRIEGLAVEINLTEFDTTLFDKTTDSDVISEALKLEEELKHLADEMNALAIKARNLALNWTQFSVKSPWSVRITATKASYDDLVQKLQDQGVQDPKEFGDRIEQKRTIETQLKAFESRKVELQTLEKERTDTVERIAKLRRELTQKRVAFLKLILQNNPFVRVDVVPYGDHEDAILRYREVIRRDDGLDDQILSFSPLGGVMASCYRDEFTPTQDFEKCLQEVKTLTRKIVSKVTEAGDRLGGWFVRHLETKVQPEDLDNLDLWFPEDTLQVQYRPRETDSFRSISQGSPGQKTAALLAFLLSHGSEPILLDQPEDDLDNQLIYNLLTRQLAENKVKRQIIVVTHNANIVVNGDAELVFALESLSGQTHAAAQGGLQEHDVRQTICDVMEGGEVAFEQRYRRIKEGLHFP